MCNGNFLMYAAIGGNVGALKEEVVLQKKVGEKKSIVIENNRASFVILSVMEIVAGSEYEQNLVWKSDQSWRRSDISHNLVWLSDDRGLVVLHFFWLFLIY